MEPDQDEAEKDLFLYPERLAIGRGDNAAPGPGGQETAPAAGIAATPYAPVQASPDPAVSRQLPDSPGRQLRYNQNPQRPRTPEEIGRLQLLIRDESIPMAEVARRYGASVRSVERWARASGIAPRAHQKPLKARIRASAKAMVKIAKEGIQGAAEAVRDTDHAFQVDPALDDPQVKALFADMESLARRPHGLESLAKLQEIILRLQTLVISRVPYSSWGVALDSLAGLLRSVLFTRRIEAEMPPAADRMALREEVARQLMTEWLSALGDEEQRALVSLIQTAVERTQVRHGLHEPGGATGTAAGAVMPAIEAL